MRPLDDFLPVDEFSERRLLGARSLTTETPVHVSDPASRHKSGRYWLVVRPFSGLIRILLLRAARRRAEALA